MSHDYGWQIKSYWWRNMLPPTHSIPAIWPTSWDDEWSPFQLVNRRPPSPLFQVQQHELFDLGNLLAPDETLKLQWLIKKLHAKRWRIFENFSKFWKKYFFENSHITWLICEWLALLSMVQKFSEKIHPKSVIFLWINSRVTNGVLNAIFPFWAKMKIVITASCDDLYDNFLTPNYDHKF